jgi:S-DNA-T family DNA segregation ATPase FtsK/SpoIIIE
MMKLEYARIDDWRRKTSRKLWGAIRSTTEEGNLPTAEDRTVELNRALHDLHLDASVVGTESGPVITRYLVSVSDGVRVRNIRNNLEDIAMRIGVPKKSIRIECCKGCIGIEVPNAVRAVVPCHQIVLPVSCGPMRFGSTEIGMGVDIVGNRVAFDLAKAPHMLVAGQTGSGKSVFLNSIICNLLMNNNPCELDMVLVDPKGTEMQSYAALPNVRVINDAGEAVKVLESLVNTMEYRYGRFTEMTSRLGFPIRTIGNYMSQVGNDYSRYMKRIVVVIDEVADLMAQDRAGMEASIARLAAKARAAGIHLVLATQRPSRDVITGTIKANLPTRVAFRLPSQVDSKTILDEVGAESLLGNGDMLFKTTGGVTRLHGCWMSDSDIANFISAMLAEVGRAGKSVA